MAVNEQSPLADAKAAAAQDAAAQGAPAEAAASPSLVAGAKAAREVMYRHSVMVRLTHWINALCLALLLMSGLRLFNYHPALYWGDYGYRGMPSVF